MVRSSRMVFNAARAVSKETDFFLFGDYSSLWLSYLSDDMPAPLEDPTDPTDCHETTYSFKSLIYLKPHHSVTPVFFN
jgi:hypothetical protein